MYFSSNLMAAIVYFAASFILLAAVNIKRFFHYYPSRIMRYLLYSLCLLGVTYCVRLFMIYKGTNLLFLYKKEDYFLRITLSRLPYLCIMASSEGLKEAKKILLKKSTFLFISAFLLFLVVNRMVSKGFSLHFFASSVVYALAFTSIYFGVKLFRAIGMNMRLQHNICRDEKKSYRKILVLLWLMSLTAYIFVYFNIYIPAHLFFIASFVVYLLFLVAIFSKIITRHTVGAGAEIFISDKSNPAWDTLQKANDSVNYVHYNVYRSIIQYVETEEPYKCPYFSRQDLAAAIGSNITYVSRALNQHAKMSFKQFVNYYRVRFAKEYFKQFPHSRLIELCNVAGFSSLSSLNQAFQLNEGMPPGEWCKKQKTNND